MSLIAEFVNWFQSLFGSSSPKPAAVLELSEVSAWVQTQSEARTQPLLQEASARFSEIRFLLTQAQSHIDTVSKSKSLEVSSASRVEKIVSSSQHSLRERMQALFSKLSPPQQSDAERVYSYALMAYPLLQKEIPSMRKEIAYTGFSQKSEITKLGETLSELEEVLRRLFNRFSENPEPLIPQRVKKSSDAIYEARLRQTELHREKSKLKTERTALEDQMTELESKIKTENTSERAVRMAQIESGLEEIAHENMGIENRLFSTIEPVDRPLRRLHQIVEAKIAPNNTVVLREELAHYLANLLNNPVLAFRSDPKGVLFKELLIELKQAIDSNTITLKDAEKQKRIDAIFALHEYDFFDAFFWKQNKLEVEKQKLEKELKDSQFFLQVHSLTQKHHALLDEKKRLDEEHAQIESTIAKTTALLEREKKQLEEDLSKLSGGPVRVVV